MVAPLLGTTRLRKKSNVGPDEEEAGQGAQGGRDRSGGPLDPWGGISSEKRSGGGSADREGGEITQPGMRMASRMGDLHHCPTSTLETQGRKNKK